MGSNNSKNVRKTRNMWRQSMRAISAVADNGDKFGETLDSIRNVTSSINRAIPTVKTVASHAIYFGGFNAFVNAAGVVAQFIQVYQGHQIFEEVRGIRQEVVAHTGLNAPKQFALQVYRYIQYEAKNAVDVNDRRKHLYFLYHPDTDWLPHFYHLTEREPLSRKFYGMSENLVALCLWMRFLRIVFNAQEGVNPEKREKDVVFHLLIPAYRPFVIKEPLDFSEVLQPLCVHGLIHDVEPYVQINLPRGKPNMLQGVGIWEKPRDWQFWKNDENPRVLGDVPSSADEAVKKQIRRHRRRRLSY